MPSPLQSTNQTACVLRLVFENSGHIKSKTSLPHFPGFHAHAARSSATPGAVLASTLRTTCMVHGKLAQALESGGASIPDVQIINCANSVSDPPFLHL